MTTHLVHAIEEVQPEGALVCVWQPYLRCIATWAVLNDPYHLLDAPLHLLVPVISAHRFYYFVIIALQRPFGSQQRHCELLCIAAWAVLDDSYHLLNAALHLLVPQEFAKKPI